MTRIKSAGLELVTSLLLLASSAIAQTPSAQQPATPPSTGVTTLKVVTQLTVEDVTVTDAKGKPVHGLTRSDFTIKEDGKLQTIRDFNEYGTEILSALPALPPLPPGIYSNQQPSAPTTSAVNILLMDDVTTGLVGGLAMAPGNLMYAKQNSMRYLKTLPPGTQVAILKLANGLHVVQGFTSDRDVMLAAINSISYKPVAGTYLRSPARIEEACAVANTQSRMALDALNGAAAFLSGINGRKNLIWFTPGIPWLTNYIAFVNVPCLDDYTTELHKAYGLLTAAQVALYPIDPRGLFNNPGMGAANPDIRAVRLEAFGNNMASEQISLQDMAKATGGLAYYNRNDLDAAVGEAIATGADYYSLSYVPPVSKYDGKYHTIDVKVDRPGLHLQYREGYTSVDLAKLPKPAEKSPAKTVPSPVSEFHTAMGHGVPDSTQLLFDVRVVPSTTPPKPTDSPVMGSLNPALKGKPLVRYDFLYALPADQITLVGDGPNGMRNGSVEFVVAAYDAEGKMLNVLSKTAILALKADEVSRFMQRPFQVPLQFDLPLGKIFIRVGALDIPSGKIGTLEIPQTVTKQ